ncbi:MAG: hypothetical protein II816_03265 [Elusimicrobia bacterium]|nr:hypothetical protein [Elusimicrobiota bacterium]
MSKEEKQKNGCLIKIYLLILFVAGIILAMSYQSAKNNTSQTEEKQTQKQITSIENKTVSTKEPFEVMLDNNIITALTSNGLQQQDVVKQYVKEMKNKGKSYNQYYKEIKLPKGKKAENFEPILTTIARNFKVGLNKTKNKDGSFKYSFYNNKIIYSELVLK